MFPHARPYGWLNRIPRGGLLAVTALAALTVLGGCGTKGPSRVAVSGTVSIDGRNLSKGVITFIPTDDTTGPKASAEIADGRYEIDEETGPVVGSLRVEIVETPSLGFELDDPEAFNAHATRGPLPHNHIPPQFNRDSTLVRETTLAGPNAFNFDLRTQ